MIMRQPIYRLIAGLLLLACSCTKYQKGFLSPNIQYLESQYTISKGRNFTSDAVNPDGSSLPLQITLLHVYDSAGNLMDSIFFKTYPVTTWLTAYNAATDTTIEDIQAKQKVEQLPPITLNAGSGVITGNFATTIDLPAGTYSLDEKISNVAGTEVFHKFVQVSLVDALKPTSRSLTLGPGLRPPL